MLSDEWEIETLGNIDTLATPVQIKFLRICIIKDSSWHAQIYETAENMIVSYSDDTASTSNSIATLLCLSAGVCLKTFISSLKAEMILLTART